MTKHIEQILKFYVYEKKHHCIRQEKEDPFKLAAVFEADGLSDLERVAERFRYVMEKERPIVWPHDRIAMVRTVTTIPEIFSEKEWEQIRKEHFIHEQGKVCNINPGYSSVIDVGFDKIRENLKEEQKKREQEGEITKAGYLKVVQDMMDCIEGLAARYATEAKRVGNETAARVFSRIPQKKPENFLEALQFFRLMHFSLWMTFNYHNTIGRFDQYMLPYLQRDLDSGVLTEDTALELLEEFFISFNKDSDLYTGMQQGDNGQSMVLGGTDADGNDTCNRLTKLCMDASLELKLIDPKINLRVNSKTPLSLYEAGTHLTKQGLGFPQYSNDDIVIPALLNWGYEKEDALQYVVAACWEFIIPGAGMDIPNIDGLSFAGVVVQSLRELERCVTFEEFLFVVEEKIAAACAEMVKKYKNVYMEPSPIMSLMMQGCMERAEDISKGNKYNNYGIHGTGLSTAVDSLAAIQKFVYQEKSVEKDELMLAIEKNFEGFDLLYNKLRYQAPKMGNAEDTTDDIAVRLLKCFADSLEGAQNDRGGIFRAGTGSAMYYIWHSKEIGATPDGRKCEEELACNYSPSLFSRCKGPLSIIKSFSKPNLIRVANGGPLTIELHDTVFRNEESITKVAMFIKSFMDMGGHQMQINAVNKDTLLDAKENPGKHRNLIVRVWGWSGYFVELDEIYQDHIIKRMELTV